MILSWQPEVLFAAGATPRHMYTNEYNDDAHTLMQ